MQLRIWSVAIAVALISRFRASTSEAATRRNLLAEGLGLLLGLPFKDTETNPPRFEQPPEFMRNLYNCWNSKNNHNCMADDTRTSEQLAGANIIRTFLGTSHNADESLSKAVHSYNTRVEIRNIQKYKFNTTCSVKSSEVLHCADLRIYKEALNEEQLRDLKNSCNNDLSNIRLQLYVKINTTIGAEDVMWFLQNTTLTREQLTQSKWFVFHNITDAYIRSLEDPEAPHYHSMSLGLALGGSCTGVSPSLLGFSSKSGKESLIVGFSKSGGITSEEARKAFSLLAEARRQQRSRRQAEDVSTTNAPATNTSTANDSSLSNSTSETTLTNFTTQTCRLHPYTISFEDLGWQNYIVRPKSYQANFCAGKCLYPLNAYHNTTKHSYIQSIVNHYNPEVIPPPCCAPKQLRRLSVIYTEGGDAFTMQHWDDMIAESCGCV